LNKTDCFLNIISHINFLQSRGYQLIMISVDTPRENLNSAMHNFKLTDEVSVPVVIVSKEEIDIIWHNKEERLNIKPQMRVDENLLYAKKIDFDTYIDSGSEIRSLVTVLNNFRSEIDDKLINFQPHFLNYDLPWKEYLTPDQCICNYKYCTFWNTNSSQLFSEQLKFYCINEWCHSLGKPSKFLDYILNYIPAYIKEDSNKTYLEYDIDYISKCKIESFSPTSPSLNDIKLCTYQTNKYLEKDRQKLDSNMLGIYINEKPLRVPASESYLKELICSVLAKNKLQACSGSNQKLDKNESYWGYVLLILIIVVAANVVIIFICRRYFSKRIHERIEEREI
jgi:hypothetical protein